MPKKSTHYQPPAHRRNAPARNPRTGRPIGTDPRTVNTQRAREAQRIAYTTGLDATDVTPYTQAGGTLPTNTGTFRPETLGSSFPTPASVTGRFVKTAYRKAHRGMGPNSVTAQPNRYDITPGKTTRTR